MTNPTSLIVRTGASVAALIAIAASASLYFALVRQTPHRNLDSAILESNLDRLDKETKIAANRRGTGQVYISGVASERLAGFETLANNALTFMEPEGMEALLSEVSGWPKDASVESGYIERLKTTASTSLAERARKRRFDSHQLLQKIDAIDKQLGAEPIKADLQMERGLLAKTRAILLSEYPRDAQHAIDLDPNNARAIYDLCRFMQDKVGSYDRHVIIRNFERIIELRWGKSEKDGDFLNANINLTLLSYDVGNMAKARCYSAQTLEKHLARSQDDYDYLFGFQPDGRINEPEYRSVTNIVNPEWSMEHGDCRMAE